MEINHAATEAPYEDEGFQSIRPPTCKTLPFYSNSHFVTLKLYEVLIDLVGIYEKVD